MLRSHEAYRLAGVTLVETLVVLGLMGILFGLLIPAVQSARATASRASCQNNLKQVGVALHNYHGTHGRLPPLPVTSPPTGPFRLSPDPNQLLSWRALILPQIDQEQLWSQAVTACRADNIPFHNPPHVGYSTVVPIYTCPADGRLSRPQTAPISSEQVALTSYLGVSGYWNVGTGGPGVFGSRPGINLLQITDGTSSTLMVGERPPPGTLQAGQWYSDVVDGRNEPGPDGWMEVEEPHHPGHQTCRFAGRQYGPGRIENPCDRYHFWSLHPTGANFLFADGGVRFLPYTAKNILPALATRAGGETVTPPD